MERDKDVVVLEFFDVAQGVLGRFDVGVVVGVDDEFDAGGFLEHTGDLVSFEGCVFADDDPEFAIDAFEAFEDLVEVFV